ncbi:MAG: hypothetical protein KH334_07225, partial [Clostridiales bacterium]|nr:hypothetical protein [Clostridiales bacterium]
GSCGCCVSQNHPRPFWKHTAPDGENAFALWSFASLIYNIRSAPPGSFFFAKKFLGWHRFSGLDNYGIINTRPGRKGKGPFEA